MTDGEKWARLRHLISRWKSEYEQDSREVFKNINLEGADATWLAQQSAKKAAKDEVLSFIRRLEGYMEQYDDEGN